MGYSAYQLFTQVVRLELNQRVSYPREDSFSQLLIRSRDGDSTINDRNALLERSITFFKETDSDTIKQTSGNEAMTDYNFNKFKK